MGSFKRPSAVRTIFPASVETARTSFKQEPIVIETTSSTIFNDKPSSDSSALYKEYNTIERAGSQNEAFSLPCAGAAFSLRLAGRLRKGTANRNDKGDGTTYGYHAKK